MDDPTAAEPAAASGATEPIIAEAEAHVGALVTLWLTPHDAECLVCFVNRALNAFGCQGDLRFALRYRDVVAPRATALERRLSSCGGYCDCEVLMNVYEPAWHLWTPSWEEELPDGSTRFHEADLPEAMPVCGGVRRGSTQPCRHWHALRRPPRGGPSGFGW